MGRKWLKDKQTRQQIVESYGRLQSYDATADEIGVKRHIVIRVIYDHQGRCTSCGGTRSKGYKTCESCRESARQRKAERYQARQALELCIQCANQRSENSTVYCDDCLERNRMNAQRIRDERRQVGLCYDCGEPLDTNRSKLNCLRCLRKRNRWKKRDKLSGNWIFAIERDSSTCQICASQEQLEVHHLIPDGSDDLENLLTLCFYCHRALTWLYHCPDSAALIDFFHLHPL